MIFVGGNLALDFVGTLSEREHAREEGLRSEHDLGDWLVASGILDAAPAVTAAELAGALRLRETIFAEVQRLVDDPESAPRTAVLRRLNETAAAPGPTVRLTAAGRVRRTGDVAAGLSAVAQAAIALHELDDETEIKWCADDRCTHPFLDRSRGHRRRWCGMAGCGDRAKAAAYRARQRALG